MTKREAELEAKVAELEAKLNAVASEPALSAILFASKCERFIWEVSGCLYLSEKLNELPERERKDFVRAAKNIHAWSTALCNALKD